MKIALTLLTAATSLLITGVAQGQVESASIHIDGMTWAGCAAGVQRNVEKIEGVERAEVDWKAKQAKVFANADGFDPAELPNAVRSAGFVPPDADVGIDVSVIGTVEARAEGAVLLLPNHQWQLLGERLEELRAVDRSKAVRLRGSFTMGADGQPPKLRVVAWEALSDGWTSGRISKRGQSLQPKR